MEGKLMFASFAKCLKEAMKKPYNRQLKLTELLLEFLIVPNENHEEYNACSKEGEIIIVDKVMASNLFNNKENVHSNIQKNCDLDIVIDGIKGYFEKEVLPHISSHSLADVIENVKKIIETDISISRAKQEEFLDAAEKNDVSRFLSSVFLYAVKKENKVGKQREDEISDIWDTNEQYYNSFVENLFLHKGKGNKAISLKDLYVIPKCEEIGRDGDRIIVDNAVNYISEFSKHIIRKERHQGEILFIEGNAGVGKSSLVSYLTFLYKEKMEEWKQLFSNRTLLSIRLRDTIPEGMKFSSDTIVKDILKYLKISSMDEFGKLYRNPLLVLDGFDELCMVEGINANSQFYIYQIFNAFRDYKVIITTRPQYLDVKGLEIESKKYIELKHFDVLQKEEWVNNYQKTGMLEYEKAGIEYILDKQNLDSICDTPMIMYMIVAGGIDEEAKHNKWVLYHQIFYKELSDTEYNVMFSNCDGIYSHGIKKYKGLIYRLSSEIAYQMFCSGNAKLFLTEREIKDIVNDLNIEDINLKEIVQHCYALCNYWKSNGKGAVEFYHNNIRDFFLCEKIFYEFNIIYQECEQYDIQEMITYINERIYNLFRYMTIPAKVVEFVYLRTKYKYEHSNTEDFPAKEYENKYMRYFFSEMLQYGGISYYDRNSGENVYNNMINILTNTVRIFRVSWEPYLVLNEYLAWFNDTDADIINRVEILRLNFDKIFAPIYICNHKIGLMKRANFEKIDLHYTNFADMNLSYANLKSADLNNIFMNRANLRDTNLSYANLMHASLKNTNLYHANLENTNLKWADLENANLRYASLENADMGGTNLKNTILPDGFSSDDQTIQTNHLRGMKIPGLKIEHSLNYKST